MSNSDPAKGRVGSADDLVDAHYRTHLGCYFRSVSLGDSGLEARSTIPGVIWNHWWGALVDAPSDVTHAYVTAQEAINQDWKVVDREVWMLRTSSPLDHNPLGRRFTLRSDDRLKSAQVIGRVFGSQYKDAILRAARSPAIDRRYYTATLAGVTVGAVSTHTLGRFTAIHDVGVLPDRHGEGIGTAIMARILGTIPNAQTTYLQCEAGWHVDFYRSMGFAELYRRIGLERVAK